MLALRRVPQAYGAQWNQSLFDSETDGKPAGQPLAVEARDFIWSLEASPKQILSPSLPLYTSAYDFRARFQIDVQPNQRYATWLARRQGGASTRRSSSSCGPPQNCQYAKI